MPKAIIEPVDLEFTDAIGVYAERFNERYLEYDGTVRDLVPPYKVSLYAKVDMAVIVPNAPLDVNTFLVAETYDGKKYTLDYSGAWPVWVEYTPE